MPWAAAIGAAGVIGGALISRQGSQSAASTQANAANQASQLQLQMQQNAINQVAPWRNAGMNALDQYSQLMGLGGSQAGMGAPQALPAGGGVQQPGIGGVQSGGGGFEPTPGGGVKRILPGGGTPSGMVPPVNTGGGTRPIAGDTSGGAGNPAQNIQKWMSQLPGYQFQMGQGTNAIENSGAARGMQLSGNTMQALDTFGQGLAGTTFNQWLDRLNNMSTLGANASTGNATNIMQTGAQVGSNMIGAGNAMAAGQVGSANALNAGLTNASNNYMNYQLMQSMLGGGGGGGGGGGTGDAVSMGSLGSGMFDLFGGGGGM